MYDPNHKCQTPGAIYSSTISGDTVAMSVRLPFDVNLSEDEALRLEAELHYAMESVLAKLFR